MQSTGMTIGFMLAAGFSSFLTYWLDKSKQRLFFSFLMGVDILLVLHPISMSYGAASVYRFSYALLVSLDLTLRILFSHRILNTDFHWPHMHRFLILLTTLPAIACISVLILDFQLFAIPFIMILVTCYLCALSVTLFKHKDMRLSLLGLIVLNVSAAGAVINSISENSAPLLLAGQAIVYLFMYHQEQRLLFRSVEEIQKNFVRAQLDLLSLKTKLRESEYLIWRKIHEALASPLREHIIYLESILGGERASGYSFEMVSTALEQALEIHRRLIGTEDFDNVRFQDNTFGGDQGNSISRASKENGRIALIGQYHHSLSKGTRALSQKGISVTRISQQAFSRIPLNIDLIVVNTSTFSRNWSRVFEKVASKNFKRDLPVILLLEKNRAIEIDTGSISGTVDIIEGNLADRWVIERLQIHLNYSKKIRELNSIRIDLEKKTRSSTELIRMKERVTPHFLFNALSTIYSMLQKEKDNKAAEAILMLSEIYRFYLEYSFDPLIPISIELGFLRSYMELLNIRYNGGIQFFIESRLDDPQLQIPPMTLQPLVENAIKHSLKRTMVGGRVGVFLSCDHDGLNFEVLDNGLGVQEPVDFSGTLGDIRKRFRMYFKRVELRLSNINQGGTKAGLIVRGVKNHNSGAA